MNNEQIELHLWTDKWGCIPGSHAHVCAFGSVRALIRCDRAIQTVCRAALASPFHVVFISHFVLLWTFVPINKSHTMSFRLIQTCIGYNYFWLKCCHLSDDGTSEVHLDVLGQHTCTMNTGVMHISPRQIGMLLFHSLSKLFKNMFD